jgi:ketosteroid isomerase-like protein
MIQVKGTRGVLQLAGAMTAFLIAGACATQGTATADIPAPASSDGQPDTPARADLIAAERAFAARSAARGTRDAFLAYLAEDAVLFIPRAAPGRPFFEQQRATKAGLAWAPIYAEVSKAGDLGFTTGPYEARANRDVDSVTAYGNFVSVWTRDPMTAAWKVAIDLGTTNERPRAARRLRAARDGIVERRPIGLDDGSASGVGDSTVIPMGADDLFSAHAAAEGTAAAMSLAASDVRVYREGSEPIVGRELAADALRRSGERLAWHPEFSMESQSSDLGYTYGTYGGVSPDAPDEGAYVRIWRRGPDGRWRLALDITNPFPK